jgi:hypothetical protein
VITGDKTWIFEYNLETKRESKEWHTSASPCLKKARMSKSNIESMLICFLTVKGLHTEFVPKEQTVNQFYYREILERQGKRVRIRPSIANNWTLHHDNAPCQMAISLIEFWAKKGIPMVPQPTYTPDVSPCYSFFVSKAKVSP